MLVAVAIDAMTSQRGLADFARDAFLFPIGAGACLGAAEARAARMQDAGGATAWRFLGGGFAPLAGCGLCFCAASLAQGMAPWTAATQYGPRGLAGFEGDTIFLLGLVAAIWSFGEVLGSGVRPNAWRRGALFPELASALGVRASEPRPRHAVIAAVASAVPMSMLAALLWKSKATTSALRFPVFADVSVVAIPIAARFARPLARSLLARVGIR